MSVSIRSAMALAAVVVLSGCAALPRERGYAHTDALVRDRLGAAPTWSTQMEAPSSVAAMPTQPLTVEDAVRRAFAVNPRVRQAYARLGEGRAAVDDARRIANPSLGYARMSAGEGAGSEITRSVGIGLGDLLLLGPRMRFANGDLDRLQLSAAADVLALASEVEQAWYTSVGAEQIHAMRALTANAAEQSATLAQRFFDAGNINRLQLEQEHAAAAQARVAAAQAAVDALHARAALADLIGLQLQDDWSTAALLHAPPATRFDADALTARALSQRVDLAAARQAVVSREDALGVTQRWRWLGAVEVGYERERDGDGGVTRGPSLQIGLPLFNQGQGATARAQAQLLDARASLDTQLLETHNAIHRVIGQLQLAHDIAEEYRRVLVPAREAIVARMQERVNFMLSGVFELIRARQDEYDAYQSYLEAVRDYWIARAELRHLVGGQLPDDDIPPAPTLGVEPMRDAAPADGTQHDHSRMNHSGMNHSGMNHSQHDDAPPPTSDDPHAHHRMPATPAAAATPDPHAHHRAPAADAADPHAAHRTAEPAHERADTPATHTPAQHEPAPASPSKNDADHHHDHHHPAPAGDTP